jgi:hypothetical protein
MWKAMSGVPMRGKPARARLLGKRKRESNSRCYMVEDAVRRGGRAADEAARAGELEAGARIDQSCLVRNCAGHQFGIVLGCCVVCG